MSFRSLRERKLLSQEQLAEQSGLSLRTIQRVEAGHRVSYASLRALAATFEMDVDVLERELYAMKQVTDEFIEVPRWARLWTNAHWYNGPRPSRRQALGAEAYCMVQGLICLAVSFLVTPDFMVKLFRVAAGYSFDVGYLMSVSVRISHTYKLWPATEISAWHWKPERTLRGTLFDYGFVLVVLVVFFSILYWVAG
jgi:transcriptional regulator with XRE-family HTH domain